MAINYTVIPVKRKPKNRFSALLFLVNLMPFFAEKYDSSCSLRVFIGHKRLKKALTDKKAAGSLV
jgi:hypothetical protein